MPGTRPTGDVSGFVPLAPVALLEKLVKFTPSRDITVPVQDDTLHQDHAYESPLWYAINMHNSRFTILEGAEDTLGEYLRVEELIRAGSPGWYRIWDDTT